MVNSSFSERLLRHLVISINISLFPQLLLKYTLCVKKLLVYLLNCCRVCLRVVFINLVATVTARNNNCEVLKASVEITDSLLLDNTSAYVSVAWLEELEAKTVKKTFWLIVADLFSLWNHGPTIYRLGSAEIVWSVFFGGSRKFILKLSGLLGESQQRAVVTCHPVFV